MRIQHNKNTGFTLVELMIVVAIIGILASVAYPLLDAYITDSKKAEGREKVTAIAHGAIVYFHKDHFYDRNGTDKRKSLYPDTRNEMQAPKVNSESIIPAPAIGTKAPIDDDLLNQTPWTRLGFNPGGSVYYGFIYSTKNNSTEFVACSFAHLKIAKDSAFVITGDADGRLSSTFSFDDDNFKHDNTDIQTVLNHIPDPTTP